MIYRPRRLRESEILRKMARETRVSKTSLILPFFIREGKNIIEDLSSMEGQKRYSKDTIKYGIEDGLKHGINSFLLFGIPEHKDELGSEAYNQKGIIQESVREIKKEFGKDVYIITDICMCEYTSHGHCGIIRNESVSNDETLTMLSKIAVSHAEAGADMVAPSDMMDGRVSAMREALDNSKFENIPIMSYAAKYTSAFYGPFREAVDSAPKFGDRKSYQMDYHNTREAEKEILLDIEEGADIIIIKPALSYLDIINNASKISKVPVAAYSVSGEYSMIKAAARLGFIDEYKMICETSISIFRAGADILITYYAKEIAKAIENGDIG